ncbi:hypothetical protein EYF80_049504 [Liparis tanakae]|uniref:Uncharacterized protein n=1 Tax=Liparis tanakae TaxID=230148 RepID=A0A4Z2FHE6_9TELE|nr:hypothetical protein EYF80_049504 [Liparis tanakae]
MAPEMETTFTPQGQRPNQDPPVDPPGIKNSSCNKNNTFNTLKNTSSLGSETRLKNGKRRRDQGPTDGSHKRLNPSIIRHFSEIDRLRIYIFDAPEPDRTGPDRTGPNRTGPDRTGPDRTEPDRTGPDRGLTMFRRQKELNKVIPDTLCSSGGTAP